MLQERLYIPFKWALFLLFADVMCFFISVYLLVGVSEKCQIYSFCFSKEEKSRTFIAMVYHLIFLFQSSRLLPPILSFQKFASITESSFFFLVSFLVSSYAFEGHFYILEHHFSFQEYHFCSFKEKQSCKC